MNRLMQAVISMLSTAAVVPVGPTTQPVELHLATTMPAVAMQPATQPATKSPFANFPTTNPDADYAVAKDICPGVVSTVPSLLSEMDSAYAKLNSVQFDGTITGNFDVGGQQINSSETFTASFAAPNQFRHDLKDDILLGSTGSNVYALLRQRDEYQTFDAPKARGESKDWPASIAAVLGNQNPSLLLMLCKSASAELHGMSKSITMQPAVEIDGVKYDALQLDVGEDHQIITMLIDPQTHLLHRVQFDNRKPLEKSGAADVKSALITISYGRYKTDSATTPDQFAWTPPTGAVQSASAVAMADAGSDLSDELKALIGQPAPDFTLKSLDDQSVTLSAQKGSVVVLDFWATWCGPCVASLPHLDALYKEQGPNGLKVFALDQREPKPAVSSFVQKKGWTIPVLLDSAAAVAGNYKVNGIPQTVIIGKDGMVKQVYVGSGHEKEIAAAVAKEMQ